MPIKRHTPEAQALGEAIASARAARDWTQVDLAAQLAARMGRPVTQSEVSLWESGSRVPTAATLTIIGDVLGVQLRPAA